MWPMKSCDLFGNKWNSPQIEFVLVGRTCLWSYLIFILKNLTPDVAQNWGRRQVEDIEHVEVAVWQWGSMVLPELDDDAWNPIVVGLAL